MTNCRALRVLRHRICHLLTVHEVTLHHRPTACWQFWTVWYCGLRCGCGQQHCELSEQKSRGEFLDNPSNYKDRPKDSVGHFKRWWIRRNCQPIYTQTAQFKQRDIVTEIKKVEILFDNAFWCCVSIYAFDNSLAVCGVIWLKEGNYERFCARKGTSWNSRSITTDSLRFLTAEVQVEPPPRPSSCFASHFNCHLPMLRVRPSSQPVRLLLPLPTSRQEATCKHRIQFSVQNPRGFKINIIMYRNWKTYGTVHLLALLNFGIK